MILVCSPSLNVLVSLRSFCHSAANVFVTHLAATFYNIFFSAEARVKIGGDLVEEIGRVKVG
jgi:uncharacterized membrane protein